MRPNSLPMMLSPSSSSSSSPEIYRARVRVVVGDFFHLRCACRTPCSEPYRIDIHMSDKECIYIPRMVLGTFVRAPVALSPSIWETRVQSTLAQTYSVSVVPPTDGGSVNA